ncbi:MAG: hypothetical protein HYX65_02340 [Gemmatimonadetes bacterium]|nr:hypothetical protein [Gemmatimonadota bacterium]
MTPDWVVDENVFVEVSEAVALLMDISLTLPDSAFVAAPTAVRFGEFDDFLDASQWPLVQEVAMTCGDGAVLFLSLDPTAQYYRRNWGFYAAARMNTRSGARQLVGLMAFEPPGSPADALVHRVERFALCSPSGGWAVIAERERGLAVVAGFTQEAGRILSATHAPRLCSAKEALEVLLPVTFRGGAVPRAFRAKFVRSFGAE